MRSLLSKSLLPFSFISMAAFSVFGLTSVPLVQIFESEMLKKIKSQFKFFTERLPEERLYIQTDKSFYKPGETIWFTAFVRQAETLKPSALSDIIHVEFVTPKGTTEKHLKLVAKEGIAQGDFDLSDHVGGLYKIKAWTQYQKNEGLSLEFEKEITVQSTVLPRLKMKLDFAKKAYGKGDEVIANLNLNTNENKPLANKLVKFKAQLAGSTITESAVTTDIEGKTQLKFKLPADLKTTDGIVNALIDYEGSTEAISRSIPIVLNQITLEFFAEGGELVNGVRGKIAMRARNEYNKAADVEGVIVDDKDQVITTFATLHMGMGAVDFMPMAGRSYRAKITKPEGIHDMYNLPVALERGYALSVTQNNTSLNLNINALQNEELQVVVQVRGKIYYAASLKAQQGINMLSVATNDMPMGVAQITLFDSKGIARCERLAFVNAAQQLKISMQADKPIYHPREKVSMSLKVTDAKGLPVSGRFAMSVVDDNLLSFADDKQGHILAKMLLEPELKETVEEPNFYFDAKEKNSAQALDNLLLTSGWRRYVWKKILQNEFLQSTPQGEKATLSGTVLNSHQNKPLAGAKLKLLPSGKTILTDKDGRFDFGWFDIATDNQIEISCEGFLSQTNTLGDYQQGAIYYLWDKRHTYPVPMVARAAGAANGRERMMLRGEKQENAGALMMQEMVIEAVMDDAPKMKNLKPRAELMADDAEKPKEHKEIITDQPAFADVNVGDLRDADLQRNDKRAAENNQPTYYRAREFPKKLYPKNEQLRNDFASTVYWNGNIETDQNGNAKVEFVTNDLISSFKATAEGFGDNGQVGHSEYNFATNLPLSLDVKLPNELVSGDKIMVPVFLKNNTNENLKGTLSVSAIPCLKLLNTPETNLHIPAMQSKLIYLSYQAQHSKDTCNFSVEFFSEKLNDKFSKPIRVVAKGFPANISLSGQDLQKDFSIHTQNVVPGSMQVTFTAFPNIMTELMKGVEAILREPYGCFEQTSSSNYPNIMVLDYMRTMQVSNPDIEKRAMQLLDKGYKKLVSFETPEKGYEWFGAAPSHEALTAYGLLEFEDMKKVYPNVDQAMIDRTRKILMDKRDGNGGFKRNPRALDAFGGADEDITNAYILYALTEAGQKDLEKEIEAGFRAAKKSNDPYLMALVANALFNVGDQKRGDEILQDIYKERNAYGFWQGKKHSITRSTGEALKIETTSLIALAVMKSKNANNEMLTSAIKFLVGARNGYGSFGSTQATILALKALTQYAKFSKKTEEAGTVEVYANDQLIATKNYAKGEQGNVTIAGLEKNITEGKQKISVRFKGCKNPLPYSMNVSYATILPNSSKQCVLDLETKIVGNKTVKVGETMRLTTTLKNVTKDGQPMSIALVGIPAGFSAQPWQLKELIEKKVVDFYELTGNNVVLYYRALAPNDVKTVNLDLKAEIPGEYDAPASSAFLYYTNEHKVWRGLDKVFVNP